VILVIGKKCFNLSKTKFLCKFREIGYGKMTKIASFFGLFQKNEAIFLINCRFWIADCGNIENWR
jgi:hypothetical protein